ncbi:DUF2523 domain-containing protein [Neisseria sp. Dent CA1/247]|uniref:DUF2523 domain-containing protein n=1 Tax=Neisseria sp. Dent CA1/247 TaxID=2912675 RepID=UPI001FD2F666|nr:DUF2523 domain-containing protein [Neisseria sp. Dent CA1/247]UOO76748.1 DUF2523 domain-containing protein [Neisseria sp. Dent CA1/247]UOO77630.1 DUF2523 domain-containing protein [Neisseria sp. Dent CA1/247]UOO78006.1 DUF2523 domain-containing protein [Neisseria sp. Dent CA1/247]
MAAGFLIPALQKLLTFLAAKLIIALGLTFVTFGGYMVGLNWLKEYIVNNFNNMPSAVFQLIMLAGFGYALGIIFGAYVFNITMASITKLSFMPNGGGK